MKKNIAKFLMAIVSTVYWCFMGICLTLAMSSSAQAYIDPSVMTYAIQVVAGVLVAVGAVVGVMWRRAKKKIQNKLGIDENAKKEVEEDVVEITDEKKN